ncbi:MAG: AraC family transcriptional regulator [Planctomycetota bacterium]
MPQKTPQFHIETEFPARNSEATPQLARVLAGLTINLASAVIYQCTPAWRIPLKRQRHDMLLLPLAGRGRAAVNGHWFSIAPRRLIYAVRGSWLQAETDAQEPLRLIVLAHRADASGGVPFAIAAGLPPAIQLRDSDGVAEQLAEACREDAQRVPGWQVAVNALVASALVASARRAGAHCVLPDAHSAEALSRISPALAVMGLDLSHPLRIAELALSCSLGQAQFRRLFRTALGHSPVAHLQRLRLAEAQRLIAGGMIVREAADAVGYSSTACLDRIFRRLAGSTPGRWRAGMAAELGSSSSQRRRRKR